MQLLVSFLAVYVIVLCLYINILFLFFYFTHFISMYGCTKCGTGPQHQPMALVGNL